MFFTYRSNGKRKTEGPRVGGSSVCYFRGEWYLLWRIGSSDVLLFGGDRGDEHTADGAAEGEEGFILIIGDITGFVEKFQPVFGFVALFQCDFKFREEVFRALCVLCLVNIRADGCAGAEELIGEGRFVMRRLDLAAEQHDLFGELFGVIAQGAGEHEKAKTKAYRI